MYTICVHLYCKINNMKKETKTKTKAYAIRLNTDLLNKAHKVIEPSELRLKIKTKINNYLKTVK